MTDDDDSIPLEACTLPGTITVTPRALDFAKRFQTVVPAGWIAAFAWYDEERMRASREAPWVDRGPGVGLGAYRIGQIPEEAIYQSGSLRYAVLIRKEIVDRHPQRTIDADEADNVFFR